jgi:hypothetical protein
VRAQYPLKTSQLTDVKAMVIQYIERKLIEKSKSHRAALKKLGQSSENDTLSDKVFLLKQTSQVRGMVSTPVKRVSSRLWEYFKNAPKGFEIFLLIPSQLATLS